MGAKTVFADEHDIAGIVDHFGELEIVSVLACAIEDYIESDHRWFAGSDFGDDVGEEETGNWEGVVLADGIFVEIDVEDGPFIGSDGWNDSGISDLGEEIVSA
jgi:hypothetical protein